MKKLWIGIIVIVAVFIIIIVATHVKKEPQQITVIGILPLTGSSSWLGDMHKWGIELAAEEINFQGGINGKKIRVIFSDDQNNPEQAVNAFRQAITTEHPIIAITAMSTSGLAIRSIAKENHIILFANGNHPELVKGNEWVFRIFLTSEQEAEVMAKTAYYDLKLKRIAVLFIDDASGEGGKNSFEKYYITSGGKIPIIEKYDKNGIDFRSEATKAIATKPEAIYIIGYGNACGKLLNQLKELGYKGQVLGTSNFGGPPISEIAKESIDGSIFTTPFYDPQKPTAKIEEFMAKVKSRYGKTAQWNTAMEYDGMYIIERAMASINKIDAESLRKALTEITNFEGVAGKYTYQEREWLPDLTIKMYEDGQIKNYTGGK